MSGGDTRVLRETLAHYVPSQVAQALLDNAGRLEPVEAEATILMCDIEGFAALTDSLGPRHTFDFLNTYFEVLVEIVERRGGVVTQFQGDAILAVFNLPSPNAAHAEQAVQAGIEIVHECDRRHFAGVRTRNRVGVASGRVVAGAVGSHGRLSYTVHGTAVNLAARLELLNKDYGTRILLTAETATACPAVPLRKVADAAVRGYGGAIALFTPVTEA